MAYLRLSNSYEKVLIDDEDEGRCLNHSWCKVTSQFGDSHTIHGYAIKNKTITLGKYILNYNGSLDIDHINHDWTDCRKENLRIATKSQNQANRPCNTNNTSGFKGVTWNKMNRKWYSQIQINGNKIYLGSFNNIKDAARAYNIAAIKHYREFAYLNKIDE